MKLGILYKNNIIVNHRSLLKVLINPILRYFGLYIGTKLNNDNILDFNNHNDYDYILKKRIII